MVTTVLQMCWNCSSQMFFTIRVSLWNSTSKFCPALQNVHTPKIEDKYLDSFLMLCNNDVKWFETPNLQSLSHALDMRYNVYLDRTLIWFCGESAGLHLTSNDLWMEWNSGLKLILIWLIHHHLFRILWLLVIF